MPASNSSSDSGNHGISNEMLTEHERFLHALVDGAAARITSLAAAEITAGDLIRVTKPFYFQLHENRSANAPFRAPPLNAPAAAWAGLIVHWICWTILNRGETNVQIPDSIQALEPTGTSPSEHWSVDLILSVLPQVAERCRAASQNDPLWQTLTEIASRWPLAAIGIEFAKAEIQSRIINSDHWQIVVSHPCLRRIARDRCERHGQPTFFDIETAEQLPHGS